MSGGLLGRPVTPFSPSPPQAGFRPDPALLIQRPAPPDPRLDHFQPRYLRISRMTSHTTMSSPYSASAQGGLHRLSITHNSDLFGGKRDRQNVESKESLVIHC